MPPTVFNDSKPHYQILDGLRGVAAIMVILMHVFEIFAMGDFTVMYVNHGYLAVDFFFLLSGFVIAHAYDDRWGKMTLSGFFKRRLIRLHPMILVGMTIGALLFYKSASPILFPGIADMPLWKMLLVLLIGYTLLPVPLSLDIRGWGEMHPLDGPAWTLFFEYCANILYALVLRRVSRWFMILLTVLAGAALLHYAVTSGKGDMIGGWSFTPEQLQLGFTRLLYPFFAGILLARLTRPGKLGNMFLWCSLLLVLVLSLPRFGGKEHPWMNGLYEAIIIMVVFPLIVYLGSSGSIRNKTVEKVSKFLGDISYPVYIIHYPSIYIFSAWVVDNKITIPQGLPVGIALLVGNVILAYILFRIYDVPVRKWLTRKWLPKSSGQ